MQSFKNKIRISKCMLLAGLNRFSAMRNYKSAVDVDRDLIMSREQGQNVCFKRMSRIITIEYELLTDIRTDGRKFGRYPRPPPPPTPPTKRHTYTLVRYRFISRLAILILILNHYVRLSLNMCAPVCWPVVDAIFW